ncbi:MAG: hypothetical protein KC613_05080, partial [Myxococcales bacterium]|nr:hypothetical protein [Myxococcales bacterium]
VDNDCDGGVDEDWQVGQPCRAGVGGCATAGAWRCGDDGAQFCDAVPGAPTAEACNGVDDDCDGRVDEGQPGGQSPCGDWIAAHCRVWLGWVDNIGDPNGLGAIPAWGDCPGAGRSIRGNVACVNSGGNQRFQSVSISGGMDDNDWLAVRFECDAGDVGPWIDRNCQVALAYGDVTSREGLQRLDPRQCGAVAPRTGPNPRCVRSGGDRLFHPVQTQGRVNTDDAFGITFFCGGDDPERAQWVQSSVEVFLGLYNRDTWFDGCWHNEINNDVEWGDCAQSFRDNSGRSRCVGAAGGRGFDGISPDWEVSRCDQFGVALRRAR